MSDVAKALEVLEQLEASGNARLPKEALLKANVDNDVLKDIFKWTYDWHVTFGISSSKLNPAIRNSDISIERRWELFAGFLTFLSTRELTGDAARIRLEAYLVASELERKWYKRVVDRDLQVRVSIGTIEKIWPGLIPRFDMQLANEADLDKVAFPVAVEPKLDGMRILFFINPTGNVVAASRGAKTYESVRFIGDQLFKAFGPGIYDGEMLAKNWGETITFVRTDVGSRDEAFEARRKSELKYYLFDSLPYSESMPKSHDEPWITRYSTLRAKEMCRTVKPENVIIVGYRRCESLEELQQAYDSALALGYEGVMLKNMDAAYESTRNDNWLKLKPMKTKDGTILGIFEGTSPNTIGKMGQMRVRFEDGVETFVGTGFTFEQRTDFLKRKDELIGKIVEIKVQDDANAVAVARFPVFVRLREDR